MLAIVLLGAGLRAYHLGFKSLWLDEAVIYQISLGSISELIIENAEHNSAPPLYPLLVGAARNVVGDSEASLRMGSLLFGVAAIPAIYWLARRIGGRHAGLVASFLVASSVSQVRYSQQLREYSLSLLLAALLLLAWTALIYRPNWRTVFWASILVVLSIFTQYGLGVLVVSGITASLTIALIHSRRRIRLDMLGVVGLAGAIAVGAVYSVSLAQQMRPGGFASEAYLQNAYWSGTSALSLLEFVVRNTLSLIEFAHESGPLLALLVVAGVVAMLETRESRITLTILAIPFVSIVGLAAARYYPYHGGRQDIILTPVLYVLAGVGASRLIHRGWRRSATLVLLAVLGFYSSVPRPSGLVWYFRSSTPEHARPVASLLIEEFQTGDALLSNWLGGYALRYYLRDEGGIVAQIEYLHDSVEEVQGQISAARAPGRRTWIFISHCDGRCIEVHESIRRDPSIQASLFDNGVWLYLREH